MPGIVTTEDAKRGHADYKKVRDKKAKKKTSMGHANDIRLGREPVAVINNNDVDIDIDNNDNVDVDIDNNDDDDVSIESAVICSVLNFIEIVFPYRIVANYLLHFFLLTRVIS